ncbi:MAG: DNA polymerase III subunit epsilon [Bauldia litoralis]
MREIVFDTETTGLDPTNGDRIVEIGCVELFNHIATGQTFHRYINPERPMPAEAQRVHGLDDKFLSDKPLFASIVADLLAFVGDAPMIAHNADFDLAFLNAELGRCKQPLIPAGQIVDSLMLARRKHPAGPNSLDALCARYQIDTSKRTLHGALLDSHLLGEVYIELIGGRQASLILADERGGGQQARYGAVVHAAAPRPEPRLFRVSEAEMAAHAARLEALGDKAIWRQYLGG